MPPSELPRLLFVVSVRKRVADRQLVDCLAVLKVLGIEQRSAAATMRLS